VRAAGRHVLPGDGHTMSADSDGLLDRQDGLSSAGHRMRSGRAQVSDASGIRSCTSAADASPSR
jgi:hypothetical protein